MHLRRALLPLALVTVGSLFAASCGGDDSGDSATTTAAGTATTVASATTDASGTTGAPGSATPLKFALLIGGPATDGGFYQAMVDGLKQAAGDDGNIEVEVRDNLASGGDASMENAVREAASSGDFDLIVAHGFDLVPAVAKFAPEFPDQDFATSLPVEGNPANVEVYLSVFEELGYNAGFLAASGTTDGKIGFIGGPGADFEKQAEAGFKQAVAKYAPDAEVTSVYTGTFEDPQLAQEAATQMIGDGVDSIWNQQAAGQSGVYTACAAAPDVNCFGNSQYSEAVNPDVVLASSVSNYTILVPLWAERLRSDTWSIGPDMLSIANGGTSVTAATAAGEAKLPDLQSAIDAYIDDAQAGKIVVEPATAG